MKQRRPEFSAALIAFVPGIVLWAAIPASARVDFSSGVCVEFADTLDPSLWMPVGCEIVDCCPGCPGNVIDWRIRVTGDALESVLLQFENLPGEAARALNIKGRARWEGSSLRVWKGETVVSGFKLSPRAAPAVAKPRLFGDKNGLKRLQETASRETGAQAAGDDARDLGRMEVVVDQLMGKYVVNEARVVYNVRKCERPRIDTDHIQINNNFLHDNTVVLLDARDANGCFNDQVFRGSFLVPVGNLQTNGNCNSELVIFSDDNAMLFLRGVNAWNDSPIPNKLIAALEPILVAPVAVWLADPNPMPGTQERAEWEMATANFYYNSHKVGIAFDATYTDVSANGDAVRLIGGGCSSTIVPRIKASSFYKPNQLNVYYIDNGPTQNWRGQTCWHPTDPNSLGHEPNIIFIDRWSFQETLAHEFGHAFSLDHPNEDGIMGINADNLMWSNTSNLTQRTIISLGQAFRMNVNVTSKLNVNGVRTGFTRDPACADTTSTNRCPRLALDVSPK
jgi:hypothetical protein